MENNNLDDATLKYIQQTISTAKEQSSDNQELLAKLESEVRFHSTGKRESAAPDSTALLPSHPPTHPKNWLVRLLGL